MSNPVESLRAYFKNDRFATENGMEIVEVRPGHSAGPHDGGKQTS